MILFCVRCGRRLKVPDAWAGETADCPSCRKELRVPAATGSGGRQRRIAQLVEDAADREAGPPEAPVAAASVPAPAPDGVPVEILTARLTEADVPLPSAAWPEIERFARTFHGFRYFADCAKIANRTAEAFRATGLIPAYLGLNDLRACLFFEQRRWAHLGVDRPAPDAMSYIRTLLAALRGKLRARRGGAAPDAGPPDAGAMRSIDG